VRALSVFLLVMLVSLLLAVVITALAKLLELLVAGAMAALAMLLGLSWEVVEWLGVALASRIANRSARSADGLVAAEAFWWKKVARLFEVPSGNRLKAWMTTTRRRGVDILAWLTLPVRVFVRIRYSAALAERLVRRAVGRLPESYREQYQAEWLAELDYLKAGRRPLLGWAIGLASTAGRTSSELRSRQVGAPGRMRALPRSRMVRALDQVKPIWLGIMAAASGFCAAAVGWSGHGQGPSRAQVIWAVAASVLAGVVMVWQTWPRGPTPQEHDADEPDRSAHQ
jgi:hypothetical protein